MMKEFRFSLFLNFLVLNVTFRLTNTSAFFECSLSQACFRLFSDPYNFVFYYYIAAKKLFLTFFFLFCCFCCFRLVTCKCEIPRGVFYICTNLGSIWEEFVWLGQSVVACQFYSLEFYLDTGMSYLPKFLLIAVHLRTSYHYLIVVKVFCVCQGRSFNYGAWVMVFGVTSASKLGLCCVVKIKVIWEIQRQYNNYSTK